MLRNVVGKVAVHAKIALRLPMLAQLSEYRKLILPETLQPARPVRSVRT